MKDFQYKDETYSIIGAAMEVHSVLGCGFLEGVYHDALIIEFEKRKIPYKHEVALPIKYKNVLLSKNYFADFICYSNVVVEIKAVSELASEHSSQVLNYLKASGLTVGLILNFGTTSLEHRRFALSNDK
ncbi:MAG: GxxExxY protein [Chloroflexi bacterium HGW-Chloroflexi-5]|jgi:GxxExxY protein|nr:MAG: GxxExxY protein [Chloroflexi bacterium HGW-Chloroflexi-5]PKP05055.1 MAG: GxxExxY protein [Bacteroidetes bacterium HGW-Bacteroidetes-6]